MIGARMKNIAKFFALPASDRALLFQSLTAIAAMRAGVWTLPFGRARRLADAMSHPMRANSSRVRPSPEKIAWAVATASRAVPQRRQLPGSRARDRHCAQALPLSQRTQNWGHETG